MPVPQGTTQTRGHEKYQHLIERARQAPSTATLVVHPCDESSLRAAVEAAEAGLIKPVLVGPAQKIAAVASAFQLDISSFDLVDAPHSEAAAEKAVELIRAGTGEVLMKGACTPMS